MINADKIKAFLFLSVGIALSACSLFATNDFIVSARSVIMLGSRYDSSLAIWDRVAASAFLLLIVAAGFVLIGVSIRMFWRLYKR